MNGPPGFQQQYTVLYLDINPNDYKPFSEKTKIVILFAYVECPSCRNLCEWKVHALYFKYHDNEQILIIRLRCFGCKHTHAIIPSFSLPHTSLDTEMVQKYLESRDSLESRNSSAKASGFSDYYGPEFLRSLEKRFIAAVFRAKVLYPAWGDEHENGYRWMTSATQGSSDALFVLNERAIKCNGQSFFGGNVRTGLRFDSSGILVSHKNTTTRMGKSCIDSC